jgi:hypothetical protein
MRLRGSLLLVLVVVPCAACATVATEGGVSRATTGMASRSAPAERRVFVAQVSGGDVRPSTAPHAPTSLAWGTVRIVVRDDDQMEYLATIYNPNGETITGASLWPASGEERGGPLATLFSDVSLRSPYIQLRGSVTHTRGVDAALLSEEIRERPPNFSVRMFTAGGPAGGALRGVLE